MDRKRNTGAVKAYYFNGVIKEFHCRETIKTCRSLKQANESVLNIPGLEEQTPLLWIRMCLLRIPLKQGHVPRLVGPQR